MIQTSALTWTLYIIYIANVLWRIVLVGTLLKSSESFLVDTAAAALVTSPSCQLVHWIYSR